MKKPEYHQIILEERLRTLATITAAAAIVLAIVFIFLWGPILFAVILGIFFLWVAWMVPWMGVPLMTAWAVLFLFQLPHSNWSILRQLPFYISLSLFLASGLMFIALSVYGWIIRHELPQRKRQSLS